jgi:hypothetical protein
VQKLIKIYLGKYTKNLFVFNVFRDQTLIDLVPVHVKTNFDRIKLLSTGNLLAYHYILRETKPTRAKIVRFFVDRPALFVVLFYSLAFFTFPIATLLFLKARKELIIMTNQFVGFVNYMEGMRKLLRKFRPNYLV